MKTVTLGIYDKFSCLAGECPSTCCSGWKIRIAEEDYRRFQNLSPEWLRQDVLSHIEQKDSTYYFQNRKDGRCAMLDEDGLCRIQRNTDEKTLCNTCRKYPRLINKTGDMLYLSMAASCPVVASYLVNDSVMWSASYNDNVIQSVSYSDSVIWPASFEEDRMETASVQNKVQPFGEMWKNFFSKWDRMQEEKKCSSRSFLTGAEKLTDSILDIILSSREGIYLLDEFAIFEQDISEEDLCRLIEKFFSVSRAKWEKLCQNYLCYRLVSRKIEMPDEAEKKIEV